MGSGGTGNRASSEGGRATAEAALPAVHVRAAAKAAASAAQIAVVCFFVNLYKQWSYPKKDRRVQAAGSRRNL